MEVKGVYMIELSEKKEYMDAPAVGCRVAVLDKRMFNPVSGNFLNSPGAMYSGMEV
jgi:hypothetical protein